jgi:hypothetical protein
LEKSASKSCIPACFAPRYAEGDRARDEKKRNQSSVACESNSERPAYRRRRRRPATGADGIQNTTLSEVKNIFTRPPRALLCDAIHQPGGEHQKGRAAACIMYTGPERAAALCLSDCIMRATDTQLAFQSAAQAAHLERNKFNAGFRQQCSAVCRGQRRCAPTDNIDAGVEFAKASQLLLSCVDKVMCF